MAFEILLADDAIRDIEDIYRYIAEHDTVANADRVLQALADKIQYIPFRLCTRAASEP